MHQHQLLSFASKLVSGRSENNNAKSFSTPTYSPDQFLTVQPVHSLSNVEFKRLNEHYFTVYEAELETRGNPVLRNMERTVQVWHRCCVDGVIFHCKQYQRRNSARLNHLACICQQVDLNANFSRNTWPEVMVDQLHYVEIHYFCVHIFHGVPHMLMFSTYRNTNVHDGLVEDRGKKNDGFQDIRTLQHVCGKVQSKGKTYIVDNLETLAERLQDVFNR